MKKFLSISILLLVFGSAVSGVPFANGESNTLPSESDFVNGLNKCVFKPNSDEIISCATERIVRSLDKLTAQHSLDIFPGVSFLSDSAISSYRSGKELKDEIEETKLKKGSMLDLIGNATARFIAGRTLKIKLPNSETIGRALEEGRGKMNKNKGGMSMGLMGIGATLAALLPLFLGKIALLTAKALIVGKIALVLALILFIPMFLNKGSSSDNSGFGFLAPQSSYGVPQSTYGVPSSQYPYARSLDTKEDTEYSQELAYAAQK